MPLSTVNATKNEFPNDINFVGISYLLNSKIPNKMYFLSLSINFK